MSGHNIGKEKKERTFGSTSVLLIGVLANLVAIYSFLEAKFQSAIPTVSAFARSVWVSLHVLSFSDSRNNYELATIVGFGLLLLVGWISYVREDNGSTITVDMDPVEIFQRSVGYSPFAITWTWYFLPLSANFLLLSLGIYILFHIMLQRLCQEW